MARIRTIKPELPQSQSIGRLSRDARLLFIQLFTVADDAGRARAASRLLASLLYPYDDDAPGLIDVWLGELEAQKQIRRYMVDGSEYLEIVKWLEHQKIDRPSASRIPPSSEGSSIVREGSRWLVDGPRTKDQYLDQGEGVDARPSRSDLKVVQEGEGKPIKIDENYQPSERAVEYAYSLGMKKADLNSELSKFIALSMSTGAKSYNPDMSFKLFCDRWLQFKLKADPGWKPEPSRVDPPRDEKSDWFIVVEGTLEHTCWNISNRENGLRPLFLCKQIRKDGSIVERAAKCPTLFPPGFNDFGERLQTSEDAA